MIEMRMEHGEHRRLWCIELTDQASGEAVTLPLIHDWHETVRALNFLSEVYGPQNVKLYQWDVHCVDTLPVSTRVAV